MATTYKFDSASKSIKVDSWDANDPVSFEKIYRYFKNNPIPSEDIPQSLGGSPYELNENRTNDWGVKNSTATITADTIEKKYNSYCTKFLFSSVTETTKTISSIVNTSSSNSYIIIYLNNTTGLSQYDEVLITGTNYYDGIYKIATVYSSYIRVYATKTTFKYPNETVSATLKKLPAISFNENNTFNLDYSSSYYTIYIAHCDRIRFSIKSNSSNIKLKGVVLRLGLNRATNTNAQTIYGASKYLDLQLTTNWQDIDLDLFDFDNLYGAYYGRDYYHRLARIYFIFEGVIVNDIIYLDGTRFSATKLTPIKNQNQITFYENLYLNNKFIDNNFNIVLKSLSFLQRTSGQMIIGTSDSVFGNVGKENNFVIIDSLYDAEVNFLPWIGNVYNTLFLSTANGPITNIQNIVANSCDFVGISPGGASGSIINCSIRSYYSGVNTNLGIGNVNNATFKFGLYSYLNLLRSVQTEKIFYNLKFIDDTQNYFIICDKYNSYTQGYKFINLDISECGTNPYITFINTGSYDTFPIDFGITFKTKIVDEFDEPLKDAIINIYDKNNTLLNTLITDENGETAQVDLIYARFYPTLEQLPCTAYFDSGVNLTFYSPFKVVISKSGYQTEEFKLIETYSRGDNYVCKGYNNKNMIKREILKIDSIEVKHCNNLATNNGQIIIHASKGYPPYKYSLDGINYYDENIFVNLTPDTYTIYVKDNKENVTTIEGISINKKEYIQDFLEGELIEIDIIEGTIEEEVIEGTLEIIEEI